MSLILTELSQAGIAMAADSAISFLVGRQVQTAQRQMWKKLLRVPRIKAGISYWGCIGHITPERFDSWLENRIARGVYTDLSSFANFMSAELNSAAGDKLIRANLSAGIHVAGIHESSNGLQSPAFYHIHNGHLTTDATVQKPSRASNSSGNTVSQNFPTGSFGSLAVNPLLLTASAPDSSLSYETKAAARERFLVYRDFPPQSISPEEAQQRLRSIPYITHNGDYVPYTIVANALDLANQALANIRALSRTPDPTQIGPRVGALYRQLVMVVQLYRANKIPRIIDGEIAVLGIRNDGTYLDNEEFQRQEALQIPPMTPPTPK